MGRVLPFPCLAFRACVGNVRTQSLQDLWNAPFMLEVANARRRDLVACADCREQGICTYCMGRSWHATGDIRQPAPALCERAQRYRAAIEAQNE